MSQSLTLNISEDVYHHLRRAAEQAGQLPEVIAAQWLALFTRNLQQDDPLEQFIGAFRSSHPDWTDKHDNYIGQEQQNQHE